LDIYAKRRDAQAFEAMANEAYKLSGEGTPEWLRICEQGRSIDPDNALYQPGGQPSPLAPVAAAAAAVSVMEATAPLGTASMSTLKMDAMPQAAPSAVDLDLDFSLDDFDNESSSIVDAQPTQMEPTVAIAPMEPSPPPTLDLDFGLSTEPVVPSVASIQPPSLELDLPDISKADDTLSLAKQETDEFRQQAEVSFGSTSPVPLQMGNGGINSAADSIQPDISFGYTAPGELTASQAPLNTPTAPDSGMLEFDLGTLSLELEPDPAAAPAAEAPAEPEDPLATKLALAEEFVSIGDDDGARALIEEVIAEASGELKAKAQRALSALS
jgi:pilus assembly protein FimV